MQIRAVPVRAAALPLAAVALRLATLPAMRTVLSDNAAGLCPEALQAIIDANDGAHARGYGHDDWTVAAMREFERILGDDIDVTFVATGTAANTLAVAALTEPWQRVICHHHSHWNDDESTAPERLTHCRTHPIVTGNPKLTPAVLEPVMAGLRGDVHEAQPGVLTISNSAELGVVYTPAELRSLCDLAHAHGYRVHVDGARFANAAASLGCDPRAISRDAGVDALCFGGTKNGLALGEAIILFPQGDGSAFQKAERALPFHRKGSGHLLSKHRFLTAPFAATLKNGVWLRHAAHANAMATRLAQGLTSLGFPPHYPVDANAILVHLSDPVLRALDDAGHWAMPYGDPGLRLTRLMCGFDTSPDDVEHVLTVIDAAG